MSILRWQFIKLTARAAPATQKSKRKMQKSKVNAQESSCADKKLNISSSTYALHPPRAGGAGSSGQHSGRGRLDMVVVHRSPRAQVESHALAPGVQALTWREFVRALE